MRKSFLVLFAVACVALGLMAAGASAQHPGEEPPGEPDPTPSFAADDILANAFFARSSPATQSDLAFKGGLLFAGNYNGFRIFDISKPKRPVLVKDVFCRGQQGDVSIWGDSLVVSVDEVLTSSACGAVPAVPATLETGWEGLRVFSLKEILSTPADADGFTRLQPAASIYIKCGSHTHTGVPTKKNGPVAIYVASYPLRSGPDCGPRDDPSDTHNPLHEILSIASVDPKNPERSGGVKEVPIDIPTFNEDPVFLPPPAFNPMRGCHDIQVDLSLKQAAAACSSVGQVWDISDPWSPDTLNPEWETDQPQVQFYHSALFSNDGQTVIFGDEIITGHCFDGTGSGQLWFHNRSNGALRSSFNIPRDQGGAYCSAHMFNNVPTAKKDMLVSSWYGGGVTVVDFTNVESPKEVAYFDSTSNGGSIWSAYWYKDNIYASDIPNGTWVLDMKENFVKKERTGGQEFNPQTQE
jgi:hypothetical protein